MQHGAPGRKGPEFPSHPMNFLPGNPLGSHLGSHRPLFAPTSPSEPGGSRTHDLRIKRPIVAYTQGVHEGV